MALAAVAWRRQPERLLGELGRDSRGAAIGRQPRGVFEHARDIGVRRFRPEREVARAEERVLDDSRDPQVNLPPLLAEILVEDGREQRMGEANRPAVALDHVRDDRRVQRLRRNARPLEHGLRGRAERRGERERLARGRREAGDPRAHELLERLGNRQRLNRIDVRVERAGQLQREERIPARRLVDPEQCLARKDLPSRSRRRPVERADAQRPQLQPPDGVPGERLLERGRLRSVGEPPGEQQEHVVRAQPSHREAEGSRRRGVQPLQIVDRDEQRPVFGEQLDRAANGDPDRPRIHPLTRVLLAQERDLERTAPRRRQPGQDFVEHVLEQIAEAHVREPALGLGRSRHEDAQPRRTRVVDTGPPERRLPDPRLALEHERGRHGVGPVDERVDGGELVLPADNLERRSPHPVPRDRANPGRYVPTNLTQISACDEGGSWIGLHCGVFKSR